MSLRVHRVGAQIAVSDIDRAARFYEDALGLTHVGEDYGGTRAYPCADGTELFVYASPAHAGKPTATVARWVVDDLERVVRELRDRGVDFERYDEPKTDDRGIHDSGYGLVAWFKDPDGNTFALEQGRAAP